MKKKSKFDETTAQLSCVFIFEDKIFFISVPLNPRYMNTNLAIFL